MKTIVLQRRTGNTGASQPCQHGSGSGQIRNSNREVRNNRRRKGETTEYTEHTGGDHLRSARSVGFAPRRVAALVAAFLSVYSVVATPSSAPAPDAPPPTSAREFYNAGTRMLLGLDKVPKSELEDTLREAEAFLESAVAGQVPSLQPPALYNLGHIRFRQGMLALKQSPPAQSTFARGAFADQIGQGAIYSADEALAGSDIQRMVAAYLRGRGAQHEMKSALAAVKDAIETYGAVLSKWQRASGDFRSTVELNQADSEARKDAQAVDQSIAKLVDTLHKLQAMARALGQQQQQLLQKLKQLRGRIPDRDMPPGSAGDDDEDQKPNGPKEGQKEGPSKEGNEMRLTPEQAEWILKGFKLDAARPLPMNEERTGPPRTRSGKTW